MWKTVCRECAWTSGPAYLKSVAASIGRIHEEDHAGHRVETEQVATFEDAPQAPGGARRPTTRKP
jgi:hypothetical protein